MSIASVALANGMNANLLRRWVTDRERSSALQSVMTQRPVQTMAGQFVPVALSRPDIELEPIRIEIRKGSDQLREFAASMVSQLTDSRSQLLDSQKQLSDTQQDNRLKQFKIDQLTHEMAILKRWKFTARSEQRQGELRHLFDETFEADLEAIGLELEALKSADAKAGPKAQPKRAPLPANLPRIEFRHEPSESVCACGCALKRIGEDVAEKLDYTPGVFTVHRHIRGKWVCTKCQTLIQAPVAAHVIDLGCGDGALLDHLQRSKRCTGYGAEIDDAQVLACARRGVDVIQQDIEAGLDVFAGSRFDVVVLSMAIQATHQTERVLREMSRLGTEGIVSFPNFGHWSPAWSILRGRMPISREMPYRWYDTPNLHLSTPKDFEGFLEGLGLAITRRAFLADGRPVGVMAGLRCTQAIYGFRVR